MEAATRTSLPSMRVGLGEGEAQPVGDLVDLLLAGGLVAGAVADDQRGELVAAEPGRGVARPGRRPGAGGRPGSSSSSPAWWPMVSLTALKPSRSMKSTAVPRSVARRPAERLADALGEQGAVGQVGERVVLGVVLQLRLQAHPFGDVPAVEDQAALVAVDGGLDVEPVAGRRT